MNQKDLEAIQMAAAGAAEKKKPGPKPGRRPGPRPKGAEDTSTILLDSTQLGDTRRLRANAVTV